MHELERLNSALTAEADRILHDHGLLKILRKYGKPFITGSYALGLMTRRDLDFSLETEDADEETVFRLGGEIAAALQMRRMLYLNEFIDRHPRLPLGLYIGGYTRIIGENKEWCLDIWAMNARQVRLNKDLIGAFQNAIDAEKRLIILEIKDKCLANPEYQHNYFSIDIYKAVTEGGIKNTGEFLDWVKENRTTDRSI